MIKCLEIENFKCFRKNNIKLNKLTILTGVNGAGKSSIIQSLLLIRETIETFNNNHEKFSNKTVGSERIDNYAINSKVLINGAYKMSLGTTSEIINAGADEIIFVVKLDDVDVEFRYNPNVSDLSIISNYITPYYLTKDYLFSNDCFYYLSAERLGPRNIQDLAEQNFINTGVQGEYVGKALADIEKNNLKLTDDDPRLIITKENVKYLLIKKQIENWMDLISPGTEINVDDYKKINSARVSLRNKYADTDFLHPYNTGFGITYVLPVIVTGLIAPPKSVFIVENPEAHLHPSGQSKIGQFLASVAAAGVQVIVETHSEHVINGIRLAILKKKLEPCYVNINFLYFEDKTHSVAIDGISINNKGELSAWPPQFFDQEEADLAQIYKLSK